MLLHRNLVYRSYIHITLTVNCKQIRQTQNTFIPICVISSWYAGALHITYLLHSHVITSTASPVMTGCSFNTCMHCEHVSNVSYAYKHFDFQQHIQCLRSYNKQRICSYNVKCIKCLVPFTYCLTLYFLVMSTTLMQMTSFWVTLHSAPVWLSLCEHLRRKGRFMGNVVIYY